MANTSLRRDNIMLPNDLSVTQDAYTFSLKKISEQGGVSEYRGSATSGDYIQSVVLTFKHTTGADAYDRASSVVKIVLTNKQISTGDIINVTKTHCVIDNNTGHRPSVYDFNIPLLNKIMTHADVKDELSAGAY